MNIAEDVQPYSPKVYGDLIDYLRNHSGGMADNLFLGSKYFFVMQREGLFIPKQTMIRVSESPAPDLVYFVNESFLLESFGRKQENMSAVAAQKGIYEPRKLLRRKVWSIYGLNLL